MMILCQQNPSKYPLDLSNDNDSDDELMKSEKVGRPLILGMLPDGYTYKMVSITHFKDLDSFNSVWIQN